MTELKDYLSEIQDPSQKAAQAALAHWDSLTHPIGSLGLLEDLTIRLAAIQDRTIPKIGKKAIIVMCADHGVYEEGISSSPQAYTQMLANIMTRGETGVCSLAGFAGAEIDVVNIGMVRTLEPAPGIIQRPVREGSENFTQGPALTEKEVLEGIWVGIDQAEKRIKDGADILGTGELGIANTTTSSAVLHLLTDLPIDEVVGLGAGIDQDQFNKKKRIIQEAKTRFKKDPDDVIGILGAVGGLDLIGLVGVYLAGAKNRVPVVIDGLISAVAALAAVRLEPRVRSYIFPSHHSREPGLGKVLALLGLSHLVNLDMRLGEGSGCPFTFMILEAGIHCMENMGLFDVNKVSPLVQVNIRDVDHD